MPVFSPPSSSARRASGLVKNTAAFLFGSVAASLSLTAGFATEGADNKTAQPKILSITSPLPPVQTQVMKIGENTSIPYGWTQFCPRYEGECTHANYGRKAETIHLDLRAWNILKRVNREWNHIIHPTEDMKHWGVLDQWDIVRKEAADHGGDCEDYVLTKRKKLIETHGLPASALLPTVLKKDGEGHLVLIVKTDRGDFVLNNLTDEILPWNVAYQRKNYIKQLSAKSESDWVNFSDVVPFQPAPAKDQYSPPLPKVRLLPPPLRLHMLSGGPAN